jgi:GNAT superfamily N-acetyltransferase
VVADDWQQQGIAHRLMQQLIQTARSHALHLMEGEVLASNKEMLSLAAELGFSIASNEVDRTIKHVSRRL